MGQILALFRWGQGPPGPPLAVPSAAHSHLA